MAAISTVEYGDPNTDAAMLKELSPIHRIDAVRAPMLVLHGANDGFITADAITAFQEGMRKAGADWQMVYFGGTVHSFTNPGADKVGIKGIAYNPKADERSWSYMQVFFKEIFK
jgi:dienelactone hydrolase